MACFCDCEKEYVRRWEWRREKVRRPFLAGFMATTAISRRPACVFFSLAKGCLHSLSSFFPSPPLFPPLLAVPLTPLLLQLASMNHWTRTHLYSHPTLYSPLSSLLSHHLLHFFSWLLSCCLSLFLSVFTTLSSVSLCIWQTWAVERQQTSSGRSVWASVCVCVCVLFGGSCAHLHVCAYAQMTKATVRLFLRQLNPIWKYVMWAFGSVLTPTKPLTLELLSCPTRTAEISYYAPTYLIMNIPCISKADKETWWLESMFCNTVIAKLNSNNNSLLIFLGLDNNGQNQTECVTVTSVY